MLTSALESLVGLQADMPAWLEKAEYLRTTAHLRFTEFSKLSDKSSGSVSPAPALKKRQASTESLRPQADGEKTLPASDAPDPESAVPLPAPLQALQSTAPTTTPAGTKINIDPRNRHLFREVREQRRKRKIPSLRDGQSGPHRHRSRLSLAIYYDSSIQEGFELLVRNISGARNILRKARTSATIRPQLLSMKEEESPWGRQGAYAYRTPSTPRLASAHGNIFSDSKTGLEVYAQLDRDLEAAQTLCEVGAHQTLRDGDCFEELDDVKTYFEACMKALAGEVAALKAQDDALRAMQGDTTDLTPSVETDTSKNNVSVFDGSDPSAIAIDGPIEADDEDAVSIIVDLSKIPGRHQYSSRSQAQSRTSSTSDYKATQNSTLTADSLHLHDRASDESDDLLTKSTGSGMDVPVEEEQAMAAALISVDMNEAEIDFSAMRNMVPRRYQEQSQTPVAAPEAVKAVPEDPELDLTAMRNAALKKRDAPGSPAPTAELVAVAPAEPGFDFAVMKQTALNKRAPPELHAMAEETMIISSEESEFDFASMRQLALKTRGPRGPAAVSAAMGS